MEFKLNKMKQNARVLETHTRIILVSYSTIVAYYDKANMSYFKTNKKWSVTTSKHLRSFTDDLCLRFGSAEPVELDQSVLDSVIE